MNWTDLDFSIHVVSINGMLLCEVEHQTDEICMAAVRQNGMALEFVKNQTVEICIEAIRENRDRVSI